MPANTDPALAALMLALERRGMKDDERAAFLRARPDEALHQFRDRLVCEQTWKPRADELLKQGFSSQEALLEQWGEFDVVLLLPERQREQTLFDFARGLRLLKAGGTLLASLPNDWGAARFEKHLGDLAGEVDTLSKYHCRAFWAQRSARLDETKLAAWGALGTIRPIVDGGRFVSTPGLFSWDKIDRGSRLLTEHLPREMGGRVAELGVGWGFLADFLLRHRPHLKELDLYDADARALEAARPNLASVATGTTVRFHWHDVTEPLNRSYDLIIMNPPFHIDRAAEPSQGQQFIRTAAKALHPDGQLWMVANQNLPYERTLAELLTQARLIIETGGFKILTGRKADHSEPA